MKTSNTDERFWLTQQGCAAVGGHRVHDDGACSTCIVCGADVNRTVLDEVPC